MRLAIVVVGVRDALTSPQISQECPFSEERVGDESEVFGRRRRALATRNRSRELGLVSRERSLRRMGYTARWLT